MRWWKCVYSFKFMFTTLHIYICISSTKKKENIIRYITSQLNRAYTELIQILKFSFPSFFICLAICIQFTHNFFSYWETWYVFAEIISLKLFIAYRIWVNECINHGRGYCASEKNEQYEMKSNMIDSRKLSFVAWTEQMQYEHHFDQHMSKQFVCCFFCQFILFFSFSSLINQSKILEFVSSILKTLHYIANVFGFFVHMAKE